MKPLPFFSFLTPFFVIIFIVIYVLAFILLFIFSFFSSLSLNCIFLSPSLPLCKMLNFILCLRRHEPCSRKESSSTSSCISKVMAVFSLDKSEHLNSSYLFLNIDFFQYSEKALKNVDHDAIDLVKSMAFAGRTPPSTPPDSPGVKKVASVMFTAAR